MDEIGEGSTKSSSSLSICIEIEPQFIGVGVVWCISDGVSILLLILGNMDSIQAECQDP